MFTVILVDDEPLIVDGLVAMIEWRRKSLVHVGSFQSAQSALEFLKQHPVDIVITDIRMPGLSGLDMIQRARALNCRAKFIVLSGYDDFSFVKRGIVLGIENYILKPISFEELAATLDAVARKIRAERDQETYLRKSRHAFLENILNRWIRGAIGEDEFDERSALCGLSPAGTARYLVALVQIPDGPPGRDAGLLARIDAFMREQHCPLIHPFIDENGHACLIFLMDPAGDESLQAQYSARERVERAVDALQMTLSADRDPPVIAAVSEAACRFEGVAARYSDALARLQRSAASAALARRHLSPLIERCVDHISGHYCESLSLKVLAAKMKTHPAYLGALFHRETGYSFTDYLNAARIERAKELLVQGEYSVDAVARKIGYHNPTYFYTVFKRSVGQSPSRYRTNCGTRRK